ncbi:MAG TPA: S26 family signal peptidase [Phycisphaerae bacterium]|nr:S26 family signal peptidase [Phycisphaerae bacterium]
MFLSVWLLYLALGMATFPGELSLWLFSGAIATHSAAVVSVFAEDLSFQRIGMRALFGILLFLGLQQLVYQPIGGLIHWYWVPMIVPGNLLPGPVLAAGEGVLYEGVWLRPDQFSRGDLVLYRIPDMRGIGYYSEEGYGLDRIVGVPGDEVHVDAGRLLVNGAAPPEHEMPIGSPASIPNLFIQLHQGQYAILPTRVRFTNNIRFRDTIIKQVSVTSDSQILGRVRFRLQPWSRFGSIE